MEEDFSEQKETQVIPLIIPDNCEYDLSTKEMIQTSSDRTKLQVYPPAMDFLRRISSRVGVISIAGKARTGKSLVAGELISPGEQPCPFELGNTMNACTYGIWIAVKTVPHPQEDLEIVVLDVEGTDAHSATQQSDTQLMVVSLLISSLLIFNSKGVFDATSLDQIEFILQLTEKITCAKGTERETGQNFSKFFPIFVWLLRDCHLDPSVDEHTSSVRDYLVRHVLKCQMDFSQEGAKRGWIRQAFQNMFPNFDAFGLPAPTSNSELLMALGTVDRSLLNPDFVEKLDEFVAKTLDQVPAKKLLSSFGEQDPGDVTSSAVLCTGQHLAEWIEVCVEAVNEGVPNIQSIGESVITRMLRNAFDTCLHVFREDLDRRVLSNQQGEPSSPVLPNELASMFNVVLNETLSQHGRDLEATNTNPSIDEIRQQLFDQFRVEIGEYFEQVTLRNGRNIVTYCENWIETEYAPIRALLENVEAIDADEVIAKFVEFQDRYGALPFVGTQEHDEAWHRFQPRLVSDEEMFKRAKNWSAAKARLAKEQAELRQENKRNEAQILQIEEQSRRAEQKFKDELTRQAQIQEQNLDEMRKEVEKANQKAQDLAASHHKELSKLYEEKQSQLENSMSQLQQAMTDLANRPVPEPQRIVEEHHHHHKQSEPCVVM